MSVRIEREIAGYFSIRDRYWIGKSITLFLHSEIDVDCKAKGDIVNDEDSYNRQSLSNFGRPDSIRELRAIVSKTAVIKSNIFVSK
jgi:hypothetical protein